ncbi:AsmA-like C-terminal domain-containing protein [uncultured Desulfuromusa sp.]|uniref:YhdP family protein n=1 Tax=uncultured Desulfuromusa sp. TaxID=219183 RepID=UPI002AA82884|nr:AsmA-like C-terminal domain-containing protein [uncultured Desulfuromusa sp.]
MNRSSARLFIRITCYALIVLATFFALLIVYLSQLDLNDYRRSLEQTMSSALKQPVQIGHSSLTFNRGFALALKNLQIGNSRAPLADIPKVMATLKLTPLFKGQLILDQVQIDNPKIKIKLPFPERPAKGTSQRLFNTLGIRILNVHNASIEVHQVQSDKTDREFKFSHLNALLRGWNPGKTGELTVSGQLQKQGGRFLFETRLPSSRNPEIWRNEEQKAQLRITNFSTKKLPEGPGQILPELMNMDLVIQGVPATGTSFNTTLINPDNNEPILSLSGRWTSASGQEAITKLKGELLKIPLSGEFYFIRQVEKYFLAGKLGADNVTLTPEILKSWQIPDADKFLRGQLDQIMFTLNESWAPTEKHPVLPHIDAKIALSHLDWKHPDFRQLKNLSVNVSMEDKSLEAKDGVFTLGSQAVHFSGQIYSLFLQPKVDFQFNVNTDISNVLSQINLWENLDISGNLPGSLRLTGSLTEPDFTFQADLNSLNLELQSLLTKKPTTRSQFTLQGHIKNQRLQLNSFSLNLDDAEMTGRGYFDWAQQGQKFSFTADPVNLGDFRAFSPLLEKLQVRGQIQPELTQKNIGLQGTLKLKNVGAHLTSVVADLNNTTGEIHLDQHGFTFQDLKTSLGQSDFITTGIFSDWKNPVLNLDLSGKKIRAHDLIFSNPTLTLHDLTGHLKIDAEEINFAPVEVRLEDDTLAVVTGKVSDFKNPQTVLEIRSDKVDVLDVINLFARPENSGSKQKNAQRKGQGPSLLIKASAKQGALGGLQFQNAEATIQSDDSRLTIYPLKFNNGKGWVDAQVEFDYNEKMAPLKVSGHVEDVDASILHQDLFKKRGLVSGLLKGDFYLEGNPKENHFWQGARGGAHAQITHGTLRKFHGLAKVFSLLNISQIFAGRLPDMDKEGMPFSLLEGSFQIGAGLIQSEDLKVTSESMNLSAVGTHTLSDDSLNVTLGIMPLRTVDKIITSIPIAGWVLAGTDKALVTAYFKITGTSEEPIVTAIPIDSVSTTVFGIFKRTFGLPGKLIKDIGSMFETEPQKKEGP